MPKPTSQPRAMIEIGAAAQLTIQEAATAICAILSVPLIGDGANQAKAEAMITLRALAKGPEHVSISNNTLTYTQGRSRG